MKPEPVDGLVTMGRRPMTISSFGMTRAMTCTMFFAVLATSACLDNHSLSGAGGDDGAGGAEHGGSCNAGGSSAVGGSEAAGGASMGGSSAVGGSEAAGGAGGATLALSEGGTVKDACGEA